MKTIPILYGLLAIAVSSPALADDTLMRLAELMEGRFDSQPEGSAQPADERLVDRRIRIDGRSIGNVVFYQQINHKETLEVYRQRILVLTAADGFISQKAYSFKEPQWYIDADAATFNGLSMDDLQEFLPDGCEMHWREQAQGFRAYMDPQSCEIISSRTSKPRQIEAEALLTRESLSLAERGYDPATGEQIFGTATGEYLLLQRTPLTQTLLSE